MPLGAFEARLLRLLAANRSPESFVGGATVLHRAPDSPRTSQDVDLFHDEEEAVSTSAVRDVETLRAAGYEAEFTTRQPSFWRASAAKDPGLSPEMILELAARFGRIPSSEEEWRSAGRAVPADRTVIKREFVEMIESARPLIASLPADEMGCFYLDPLTLQPVCPDPHAAGFATLIRHRGRLGGAWPQVAE